MAEFDHTGGNRPHLFRKGVSGNPAGRPRGARSKFSDAFFQDIAEVWELEGMGAMIRCARDEPSTFVRVAAALMPKQAQEVAEDYLGRLSDDDVDMLIEAARAARIASHKPSVSDAADQERSPR